MILIPHLIIGAVIAVKLNSIPLIILLAFLSHYLLDSLPHAEYSIKNIKTRKWEKSGPDFLKLAIDLITGIILLFVIYYITRVNYLILLIGVIFAILPDILVVLNWIFPDNKTLKKHFNLHHKIHFPEDKKIPFWEKLTIELLVVLFGFLLLLTKV